MSSMIVAIDGPAGAGKSTVARAVAERLGFTYLDTGAMYRCAGLAAQDGPVEAAALRIELRDGRVFLDGREVTEEIRTPEAGAAASRVATDPSLREALVAQQRRLLADGADWVAEGRDIGTVVAPDAPVKVWLDASEAERAARREISVAELRERDHRDAQRAVSPMVAASDAVHVDTTGRPVEDVVAEIAGLVAR